MKQVMSGIYRRNKDNIPIERLDVALDVCDERQHHSSRHTRSHFY